MAFLIRSTLQAIESHLLGNGWLRHVQVGEPKSPPASLTGAIFMKDMEVKALTLADTIELHVVTIRIYESEKTDPTEDTIFVLDQVVAQIEKDLIGDYDLRNTIRNIDVGGKHGVPFGSVMIDLEQGGQQYRAADITVPLEVDGSAVLAK